MTTIEEIIASMTNNFEFLARVPSRYTLVILDTNIGTSIEHQQFKKQCQLLTNSIRTFTDVTGCIEFIHNQPDDHESILVVSIAVAEQTIPLAHPSPQLSRIYIDLSNQTNTDTTWTTDYEKVRGNIFNNLQILLENLPGYNKPSKDLDTPGFSFISQSEIQAGNRQDPTFMYQQLLKDILLNDTDNDSDQIARKQMIDFCRKVYATQTTQLPIIDEFEAKFHPSRSFFWYTRECFLYEMINKALRRTDPVALYKLRYFIRHLHGQIAWTAKLNGVLEKTLAVYRGQGIRTNEFNRLKKGVGGLLSFNSFLSTSISREVGLYYAEKAKLMSDEVSVLFSMEIDPKLRKCPFTYLGEQSYYRDGEQEVLFTAGTVFRIQSVDQMNADQWEIRLSLSEDTDEVLAYYTKKMRDQTRSKHPMISLIRLLDEMGQYKLLDDFANLFTDDQSISANSVVAGAIEHALGGGYHSGGNQKKALFHLQNSLAIYLQFVPENHHSLSPTYNNIGRVYCAMKDNANALISHEAALQCQLDSDDPNIESIVAYHNNLAYLHESMGHKEKASYHFKQALELQRQFFGDNHPDLSRTYKSIARLCDKNQDYKQAISLRQQAEIVDQQNTNPKLESEAQLSITNGRHSLGLKQYATAIGHFKRALEIQQQYLLPNHEDIAKTYNNIAHGFFAQGKHAECLAYYQKTLELEQSSLADDHPTIATTYNNLSIAYVGMKQYEEALEYAKKAVEQCRKRTDLNYAALRRYIDQMGTTLHRQGRNTEAIQYFEESLAIDEKYTEYDERQLASVYYTIGKTYFELKKLTRALTFYQKTLDIELLCFGDESTTIAATYGSIADTYEKMLDNDNVLINLHEAVAILRKQPDQNTSVLSEFLFKLADKLQQNGSYHEAIELYTDSLCCKLQVSDHNDASMVPRYYRLGICHEALHQYVDAASFFQQALSIELQTLSDDEPTIATTYEKLASVYSNMEDYDQALSYAQEAVTQLRKRTDVDLLKLGRCLNKVANTLEKQRKHHEALIYFEECLSVNLCVLPDDHSSLIGIYFNTARAYQLVGRFKDALDLYENGLKIELEKTPDDAESLSLSYFNISSTLASLERYDDAIRACEKSIEQLSKKFSSDHRKIQEQRTFMDTLRKKRDAKSK